MTDQRPTTPVLGNMAKHAMLDFVPLAGPGWKVADVNGNAQSGGQILQSHLPQAGTNAIAPATIRRDQQIPCLTIIFHAHLVPPTTDRFGRKPRGIVVDAYTDPALVLGDIVNPIRDGFAQVFVHKVMDQYFDRFTLWLPLASTITILADQFLLFRIHRDHRLTPMLKVLNGGVEVFKLGITIRMIRAFFRLSVALQTVARREQQSPNRAGTDRVPLFGQFTCQSRRALASPAQGRLGITTGRWLKQLLQCPLQVRIKDYLAFASATFLSHPLRRANLRSGCPFRQFPQPFTNRIGRHPNGTTDRTNTPPSIGLGFRSSPLSTRSFVQHRYQRSVDRFYALDCSGSLHEHSKPPSQKYVNLF